MDNNDLECRICGIDFDNFDNLEKHIVSHKVKKADYLKQHFDKKDLYSGEDLQFGKFESYFTNLFNNKSNLKKFYTENKSDKELLEKTTKYLYKQRLTTKGYNQLIGESESRSLILPSIRYIEKNYGCEKFAKELNFETRFNYNIDEFTKLHTIDFEEIFIDTREKLPLKFPKEIKTISQKLDYGDYSINNDYELTIERKSLTDFVNTMSGGFERFCREIEGAKNKNKNLVVLVESSINSTLSFDYNSQIRKYTKRISPSFVFYRMREICRTFDNVQFLFCNGRKESSKLIVKLLGIGKEVNCFDLQFLYSSNLL